MFNQISKFSFKFVYVFMFAVAILLGGLFLSVGTASAEYNYSARIFNGTISSLCSEGGSCGQPFNPSDKIIIKWNATYDTCQNDDPALCLGAWISNEINGQVPNGSGQVLHLKSIWIGPLGENSPYYAPGGLIYFNGNGTYEEVMNQGTNSSGHVSNILARPNGYGAVFAH